MWETASLETRQGASRQEQGSFLSAGFEFGIRSKRRGDRHPDSALVYTLRVWEGLDVRTVGVSFNSVRVEQLGEWVMSQLDARLGRGYSSVGVLDRLPAAAPSEWDGTFNRRQSDRLSPSRPRRPPSRAEVRRVVLVESDQYYREVLTDELLRQGFVVHAFADGASLLGSLATVGRCRPCRARLGPARRCRA